MPTPIYGWFEGETQGVISSSAGSEDSLGGKMRAGHEDQILVQGYEHQVHQPTDVQSGAPTGKRLHKEIRLLTQIDSSPPVA